MQQTIRRFKLSEQFIETYKDREVPWGPVGYITCKRTYARRLDEFEPGTEGTEEWFQICRRVIEGMFTIQKRHVVRSGLPWNDQKAQRTAKDAYERLFTGKWTPPGRGLWMMGTKFVEERTGAGLFNCFHPTEEFFFKAPNSSQICKMDFEKAYFEFDNCSFDIPITDSNGKIHFHKATVQAYGTQSFDQIIFRHYWGKSNYRFSKKATSNHRWVLADGTETTSLKEGDLVRIDPVNTYKDDTLEYQEGFAHGLIFGDGYQHNQYHNRKMIRLCSDRDKEYLSLLENLPWHRSTVYCQSNNGDPFVTLVTDENNCSPEWKQTPKEHTSLEYKRGFLQGWIIADASFKRSGAIRLDTQNKNAATWATEWAPLLGYTLRGWSQDNKSTNFGPRSAALQRLILSAESSLYKVERIDKNIAEHTAYCLEVPDVHKFTLNHGLVTGNCGFRSTKDLKDKGAYLFSWMMDALMVGIGVGFDVFGANTVTIQSPIYDPENIYWIEDSREGWVESVEILLNGFLLGEGVPVFNYDLIRQKGERIKGFGGISSGPGPLIELHQELTELLSPQIGRPISSTNIVDICNLIGKCVVAGNVRRSAELALGRPDDKAFVLLKQDQEKLKNHRWCSNNSIVAEIGMDYTWHAQQSATNGEPGYIWLDTARHYGRLKDDPRDDDLNVMGFNPCVEQQLEDGELCCLTETFPSRHESYEDWLRSLKIAYLYAKTVTLVTTQWPDTNQKMLRNRRIGLSMTGFIQACNKFGRRTMYNWCDNAYQYIQDLDRVYSDWLCIPRSRRTTSIKPSGTVSKLFGVTPGCHYPEAEYYIQRIRIANNNNILPEVISAGYKTEPCVYQPDTTVVEFPIHEPYFVKSKADVSMWEQLEIAAQLQHYWADNSVSVTVTFRDHEADSIQAALEMYETRLKAVSFLRYAETGYEQAPMEPITQTQYEEMVKHIVPITHLQTATAGSGTKYCDGEACEIDYSQLS